MFYFFFTCFVAFSKSNFFFYQQMTSQNSTLSLSISFGFGEVEECGVDVFCVLAKWNISMVKNKYIYIECTNGPWVVWKVRVRLVGYWCVMVVEYGEFENTEWWRNNVFMCSYYAPWPFIPISKIHKTKFWTNSSDRIFKWLTMNRMIVCVRVYCESENIAFCLINYFCDK